MYLVSEARLKQLETRVVTRSDTDVLIYLCTFPKNGTTLMQRLLQLLLYTPSPLDPRLHSAPDQLDPRRYPLMESRKAVPWVEIDSDLAPGAMSVDEAVNLPSPRCFQSHWYPNMHLKKQSRRGINKFVVIMRNPFDTIVSFYFHSRGFEKFYLFTGDFPCFFDAYLAGKTDFNDYFGFQLQWFLRAKDDPSNVLLIFYEDIVLHRQREVTKVANFLGIHDPSIIEQAVAKSAFDVQKREEAIMHDANRAMDKGAESFFRKGEIGDWRNHFTSHQYKRLCDRMNEEWTTENGGSALTDIFHPYIQWKS